MSLSSPAPFGDVIAPSIEEDARGFLGAALLSIRGDAGQLAHECASHAIAILGETDGILEVDLVDAVFEASSKGRYPIRAAKDSVDALEIRNVVTRRRGRVFLNPALTEAIVRELFR